jgi:hypothetical protein
MTIEHRRMRGIEIRVSEDGPASVTLQLIVPGRADDYGTSWDARSLDKGLEARLPTLCWAHSWDDPIGSGSDWEGSDGGPRVKFEFDDFDAVPRAKQAYAQLRAKASGGAPTIQDCSIGFSRVAGGTLEPTEAQKRDMPGIREHVVEAVAEETSLVIRGAVPGAKVLAVRSANGAVATVSEEFLLTVARKVAAGEMSQEEGVIAVGLAGGTLPDLTPEPEGPTAEEQASEADALLNEALDSLG